MEEKILKAVIPYFNFVYLSKDKKKIEELEHIQGQVSRDHQRLRGQNLLKGERRGSSKPEKSETIKTVLKNLKCCQDEEAIYVFLFARRQSQDAN